MNVKVTGVPMRTRRMSVSDDPRVGQLVATTGPKRSVGMQTLMCENSTTPRRPHNTRHETQPQGWSSLTLEIRSHPWVLAGHPQYTGAWFAREAVDGPKPPQPIRKPLRTLTNPESQRGKVLGLRKAEFRSGTWVAPELLLDSGS